MLNEKKGKEFNRAQQLTRIMALEICFMSSVYHLTPPSPDRRLAPYLACSSWTFASVKPVSILVSRTLETSSIARRKGWRSYSCFTASLRRAIAKRTACFVSLLVRTSVICDYISRGRIKEGSIKRTSSSLRPVFLTVRLGQGGRKVQRAALCRGASQAWKGARALDSCASFYGHAVSDGNEARK